MNLVDDFVRTLHERGGSDLHLVAGAQPMVRLHGELHRLQHPELTIGDLDELLKHVAPPDALEEFGKTGDADFAYEVPGVARCRVNAFRQKNGPSLALRLIPQGVPSIADLGLPPLLAELAMLPKGLVLVTGPTGSGKTTTLAAMLDHANQHRRNHILTIEDPIEYVHQPKGCLVQQRELGAHTTSFGAALRGALREDPDILLVGEMRDLETIRLALLAAETGHLVLSTLHTTSAAKTVDRIIDVFPAGEQGQVRSSLAESLRAVIAQSLLQKSCGQGRVAALEIMTATTAVRNMIRESKSFQLSSVIQTGRGEGMCCLDDEIDRLLQDGTIDTREALAHAVDRNRFL